MSYSPMISIMAASVALSASSKTRGFDWRLKRRHHQFIVPVKSQQTPARKLTADEHAAQAVKLAKQQAKREKQKLTRRMQSWMQRFREGKMTNAEFQHRLQYDKGFLEFAERALKVRTNHT